MRDVRWENRNYKKIPKSIYLIRGAMSGDHGYNL